MSLEALIASGAVGWAVGQVADVVGRPIKDALDDVAFRRAISDALTRALQRADGQLSPEQSGQAAGIIDANRPILFTLILDRLQDPAASSAPISGELSNALSSENALPRDICDVIASAIDAELWAKDPLAAHRRALSDYVCEATLLRLAERIAPDISAAAILARVRRAAKLDSEKRLSHVHKAGPCVPRKLKKLDSKNDDSWLGADELAQAIDIGWTGAIVDIGGVGKTTYLQTLATVAMNARRGVGALTLDLTDVSREGDVLKAVLGRDAYRQARADTDDLARLARDGRLWLFLDGWNELSREQRKEVRDAIGRYRNDFPTAPLLFATRPFASRLPSEPGIHYGLDRLSYADQLGFIVNIAGEAGRQAFLAARTSESVRGLLGTPFFLSLFAKLPWGKPGLKTPETSADLIGAFVDHELRRDHYLDAPLHLRPDGLVAAMRNLAGRLVRDDRMTMSLQEAIAAILTLNLNNGPALHAKHAEEIIEFLALRSLMHTQQHEEVLEVSFDHQLFRDYFASDEIVAAIRTCADDAAVPCQAVARYVDDRRWSGAVEMAVGRLGGEAVADVGLKRFLYEACGVEPLFAADLLFRISDGAWASLEGDLTRFVDAWSESGGANSTFSFMIRTGRPVFSERIWAQISAGDDRGGYGGIADNRPFAPEVLGADWLARMGQLDTNMRRGIVFDLAFHGGFHGVELAAKIALKGPHSDELGFVFDAVSHHYPELAPSILDELDAETIERWAYDRQYQELADLEGRTDYLAIFERDASSADAETALRAQLELVKLRGEKPSAELIHKGLDFDRGSKEARHHYRHRFKELAPEILSDVLLSRALDGDTASRVADDVLAVKDEARERLFERLCESEPDHFGLLELAKFLNAAQVRALITEVIQLSEKIHETPRMEARDPWKERRKIEDILKRCDARLLTRLLMITPAGTASAAAALCGLINARSHDHDRNIERLDPAGPRRILLSLRIRQWCDKLLEDPETPREWLAAGANAIAALGRSEDVTVIKNLLDRELDVHEKELAAFRANPVGARSSGNSAALYCDNQFGWAFRKVRSDEARDVLLSYMGDPRFEAEAASGLRVYAPHRTAHLEEVGMAQGLLKQYTSARDRRRAYLEAPDARCHPVAAAILDSIAAIDRGSEDKWRRIRNLAAAVAGMECGERLGELLDLVRGDPEPEKTREVFAALSETGMPLKGEWLMRGADAAAAVYANTNWPLDQKSYMITRWLDLFARSDTPGEIPIRLEQHPELVDRHGPRHYLDCLVVDDPDDEIDAVEALAALHTGRHIRESRNGALLRIETQRSMLMVLDDALSGEGDRYSYTLPGGRGPLAPLFEKDPGLIDKCMADLQDKEDRPVRLNRLATIMSGVGAEDVFDRVTEHCVNFPGVGWEELAKAMVRARCVLETPVGASTYETHQRSVASVRAKIFGLIHSREDQASFWKALLEQIDAIVRDFGGHPDDPRHPDLSMGEPHPAAAKSLWDKAVP